MSEQPLDAEPLDTKVVQENLNIALETSDKNLFTGAIIGIYAAVTGIAIDTFDLDRAQIPEIDQETLQQRKIALKEVLSQAQFIYLIESTRILQVETDVKDMMQVIGSYIDYKPAHRFRQS